MPIKRNNIFKSTPSFKKGAQVLELTDYEIEQYRKGGYIVEEYSEGGLVGDPPPKNSFDPASFNRIYEDLGNRIKKENEKPKTWIDYTTGEVHTEKSQQEKIQYLPEQQIYATSEARKKYEDVYAKAQSLVKTFPRAAEYFTKNKRYDKGIEGVSEYVKDITDFQKSAEDYYKARQSVKKGRMSTEDFKRAYEERGWDRFDNKVTKTSAEDQKELEETWYGKMDQEGRRYWMSNPMNVAKVAKVAAASAVLGPGFAASGLSAPLGYLGRVLNKYATLSNLRSGLSYLNAPAVIGSNTVPWLTANNALWGVGAGISTGQIANPNSALRTSASKAIDNPTFENITNAGANTLLTAAGYLGLPFKAGVASLADDVSGAGKYLTQTFIKDAYKLNPRALKEKPFVPMYRTQKPGQTQEVLELIDLQKKADKIGISNLSTAEKIKLSQFQTRPNIGQGFDTDLSRASYYGNPNIRKTRGYDETSEVLRTVVPREQAELFNVKNFPEYAKQSTATRTEHILPMDMVQQAEKFSFDDLARLREEESLLNPKPHWWKGYNNVTSSIDDVGRGLGDYNKILNKGLDIHDVRLKYHNNMILDFDEMAMLNKFGKGNKKNYERALVEDISGKMHVDDAKPNINQDSSKSKILDIMMGTEQPKVNVPNKSIQPDISDIKPAQLFEQEQNIKVRPKFEIPSFYSAPYQRTQTSRAADKWLENWFYNPETKKKFIDYGGTEAEWEDVLNSLENPIKSNYLWGKNQPGGVYMKPFDQASIPLNATEDIGVHEGIHKAKLLLNKNNPVLHALWNDFTDAVRLTPSEAYPEIFRFRNKLGLKPGQTIDLKTMEDNLYLISDGYSLPYKIKDKNKLLEIINKAPAIAPFIGIGTAAASSNEYKQGGVVMELTKKQIADYIKKGLRVENY